MMINDIPVGEQIK